MSKDGGALSNIVNELDVSDGDGLTKWNYSITKGKALINENIAELWSKKNLDVILLNWELRLLGGRLIIIICYVTSWTEQKAREA